MPRKRVTEMPKPSAVAASTTTLSGDPPAFDEVAFISEARTRRADAIKADTPDRELALKDVDFNGGDQWEPSAAALRKLFKQPVLVWNRFNKFNDQICNDGRKRNGAINIVAGDLGKPQTAQVLANRVRQIEYESEANIAYDTAREGQVVCGRGFYRVITEYAQPPQWKQVIRIRPIEDQFSVLWDPVAKRYDRQDAGFLFVDTIMNNGAYKRQYPKSKVSLTNFFDGDKNPAEDWLRIDGDNTRVAEYWLKTYTKRKLVQLANKNVLWEDELNGAQKNAIVDERWEQDWSICQYIIDGVEILNKTEWPIKLYPIIPQWGRQEIKRRKKFNVSAGRYAHDPQKLVNLYVSNIAGHISQQPKTPFIAPEGSFDNNSDDWQEVNEIPKAFLEYKPQVINGVAMPGPQRQTSEPPIQALALGLNQAEDAMKAAFGIYNPSLGADSPDTSAVAIQERNTESDTGNYHFGDNEARSRKTAGMVVLALIKKIDAGQDSITVRSYDGKTSDVKLKKPVQHDDGSIVTHDLSEGMYDSHVIDGPGFTSMRDQAFKVYSTLAHQDPNFMQIGGDIMFRNADWPGAQELADRYERNLPDHLQKPGNPAMLQKKLSMGMQMISTLTAKVHELQSELDAGLPKLNIQLKIAEMQEETKRQNLSLQATIAEANLGVKTALGQLQHQITAITASMQHVREGDSQAFDALMNHFSNQADQADQQAEDDAPDDAAPAADGEAA